MNSDLAPYRFAQQRQVMNHMANKCKAYRPKN